METGIVARLQQMTQFMNHHMFGTPLRQQQQIDLETNATILDIAHTPAGNHCLIIDQGRMNAHCLRVAFHHRLYQGFQTQE
jgi:hypothetical protein